MPDHTNIDYRGFAFVVHNQHGMLLLHCTRKAKKGPHFQLPGGHVDEFEFKYAAEKCGPSASLNDVLLEACKMGTARELLEETGMDVRSQLDRLQPAPLSTDGSDLECMLDEKCYFSLAVTDDDFPSDTETEGLKHPMDNNGSYLAVSCYLYTVRSYVYVNCQLSVVNCQLAMLQHSTSFQKHTIQYNTIQYNTIQYRSG